MAIARRTQMRAGGSVRKRRVPGVGWRNREIGRSNGVRAACVKVGKGTVRRSCQAHRAQTHYSCTTTALLTIPYHGILEFLGDSTTITTVTIARRVAKASKKIAKSRFASSTPSPRSATAWPGSSISTSEMTKGPPAFRSRCPTTTRTRFPQSIAEKQRGCGQKLLSQLEGGEEVHGYCDDGLASSVPSVDVKLGRNTTTACRGTNRQAHMKQKQPSGIEGINLLEECATIPYASNIEHRLS
mmetsp:Transcript_8667/g.35700  ORF Transcript_8667/g.35700 Transcript_8667/m.35700 type:complete len:242 (-) Transcript_8667:74-799(-)